MNIKQFFKLKAVEDKALLRVALILLLDLDQDEVESDFKEYDLGETPNYLEDDYSRLSGSLKQDYKRLILDLCDLPLEDYDRLLTFVKQHKIEDLEEWFNEKEYDFIEFEVFKPLLKSYIFRAYLACSDKTGEVHIQIFNNPDNCNLTEQLFHILEHDRSVG